MKGRFGMLHATAFVVAIMARLIRTQDVPVSTVKPHRGYDHCNPGCVGVVITPAYYPQVSLKVDIHDIKLFYKVLSPKVDAS